MNHRMIQSRIENSFLFLCSTFYQNTTQIIVPFSTGISTQFIKCCTHWLFCFQIQTGIFNTDKRHTDTNFQCFIGLSIKSKPGTDIITTHHTTIIGIKLILSGISIPFSFRSLHWTLLFPISPFFRSFMDSHDKINRENRLWIIAESTEQLGTLYFAVVHKTHGSTTLVSQTFPQVQKDITLTSRERKTCTASMQRSRHFALNIILG